MSPEIAELTDGLHADLSARAVVALEPLPILPRLT
jgi:hypothetical protein